MPEKTLTVMSNANTGVHPNSGKSFAAAVTRGGLYILATKSRTERLRSRMYFPGITAETPHKIEDLSIMFLNNILEVNR